MTEVLEEAIRLHDIILRANTTSVDILKPAKEADVLTNLRKKIPIFKNKSFFFKEYLF